MYCRCSHCQTLHTVNAEQLRSCRGLFVCTACAQRFDALASLSDLVNEECQEDNSADLLPVLSGKSLQKGGWRIIAVLSVLLLCAQLLYFEGGVFLRQTGLRTGLEFICNRLGWRLPTYKNLDEWSVSHSDLQTTADKRYVFSAAITNQAAFPQAYPDIKLVLLDFNGQAVAERIFIGREYSSAASSLTANGTAEISLNIVAPSGGVKISGYTFALL